MPGFIAEQFQGLPMKDLIGAPLSAATDAQVQLAKATADYISTVGLLDDGSGNKVARTVEFTATQPVQADDGSVTEQDFKMVAPMLAIVPMPALAVKTVNITFEMSVKTSTSSSKESSKSGSMSASASGGWGPFSLKAEIKGSIASSSKSQRSTDQSARYTVTVIAEQQPVPEGLSKLTDTLCQLVGPRQLSAPPSAPPAGGKK